MADRFFIAPYDKDSGIQTNVKPWLIPDTAFSELNNAYVFRGRVRKRFGSRWLGESSLASRFRINIGTTAAVSGNFVSAVPLVSGIIFAVGQQFSIGSTIFTVTALGSPVTLLTTGTATATLNTVTGALVVTGNTENPSTAVYFYPSLPVMGLLTFETATNSSEKIIGFDTRYAYEYNNGWERLSGEVTPNAAIWSGSNSQFFWGSTWTGVNASDRVFFVTNFNATEANYMRRFFNNQWDNFRPAINATDFLDTARILVPFKNRLIALNTVETITGVQQTFQNRARYSQIGSPLDANAWRQDIAGRGNAIDCPTTEAIITVEFIRDRLIVFFERSTWELVYVGNQAYPFVWQQINTELGAESTFSIVPFDKVALGVGNVGIMACNGANIERIDDKIPETVFDIHNVDSGVERVYGIRDYFVEMVYWSFPSADASTLFPYPNRVLVYNYKTGTWSFNSDSVTAFGYFQPQSGISWDSTTVTWDDAEGWDSGSLQALFRQVVAGNQQGYTFIIDSEETTNAPLLSITGLSVTSNVITITCLDHNLRDGEYVYLQGISGTGNLSLLNNKIYRVTASLTAANTFTINYPDPTSVVTIAGTYSGGGLIARVSNILIKTKEYNFYAQQGRNAYVSKVDFLVDRTDSGQMTVDFFVSTAVNSMIGDSDSSGTGSLLGTSILETTPYSLLPYEAIATRLWHPLYLQADGECIQLQVSMSDAQMRNTSIREADFQLHALCIHAQPTSQRLQ